MPKPLIFSLILNATLVVACGAILLWPDPTVPEPVITEAAVQSAATAAIAPAEEETTQSEPTTVRTPPPSMDEMNHDEQIDLLVAAGWSPEDAKVFALGRVMHEGMRVMFAGHGASGEEYWKQWRGPDMDWEAQREMMKMQHRMQEAMEDLFGSQIPGMFGTHSIPLPREKVRAAALIQQDYQLMQQKLHADAGGIMLPEDHQAIALLEEERKRDLASILTPEELFEYEVRTSSTSMSLRHRLNAMEPTEEEFREIFRLQYEVDQLGGARLHNADEETRRRHSEASENMQRQLQEALGEDRYRQYQRNQDYGYGQLVNVVQRLDLPREHVDTVYDIKEYTDNRRQEIQQNRELSNEDRQNEMQLLSKETTEDLTEILGEDGLNLYRQNGGHWLHQLR